MDLEDAGTRANFVLHDRDASFTSTFDSVFQAAGIRVIRSAVQAPRMNAYAERFVLTARTEVTDRMLIFGQRHLRTIPAEYETHYNGRRPHRSRQPRPPWPDHPVADPPGSGSIAGPSYPPGQCLRPVVGPACTPLCPERDTSQGAVHGGRARCSRVPAGRGRRAGPVLSAGRATRVWSYARR